MPAAAFATTDSLGRPVARYMCESLVAVSAALGETFWPQGNPP